MKIIIEKLKENLFIIIIGVIYCFSFSGISVGDLYFRSLENGYPLFYSSNFSTYPLWLGFEPRHFLNIPTLRLAQLLIAKLGLFPNALLMIQLVNLFLGLFTLKIIYSILKYINIDEYMSKMVTVFFAFSYGFYANMNGEIHHFSIFLLAVSFWLLLNIENKKESKKCSIFTMCLCLALLPLYHNETVIFSGIISFYILFKRNLRIKFKEHLVSAMLGLIVVPIILIFLAIFFHYIEAGSPAVNSYINTILLPRWRFKASGDFFISAYSKIDLRSFYVMARSQLESFSIISRVAKLAQYYKDVTFYASSFFANSTIVIIVLYVLSFLAVNSIAGIYLVKNWRKAPSFLKILMGMLGTYLIFCGVFLSNCGLLSEFYITSVMIQCLILGYIFNKKSEKYRLVFYFLIILTVISNIGLFFYPQKVSANSINSIFTEIEANSSEDEKIVVARVSFFDFPYDVSGLGRFKMYLDEHAYDSKLDLTKHINLIDKEFNNGKKVYLIAPGFLFGDINKKRIDSLFIMGAIEYNQSIFNNLKKFLKYIDQNYSFVVTKKYYYNFSTLGQLGKLAVVELKEKIN